MVQQLRMIRYAALAVIGVSLLLSGVTAAADVIRFKNGRRLEGKVLSRTADKIIVGIAGTGQITVSADEVASIEEGPEPVAIPRTRPAPRAKDKPASLPGPLEEYRPDPLALERLQMDPAEMERLMAELKARLPAWMANLPLEIPSLDAPVMPPEVSVEAVIISVVVVFLMYLYYILCLYLIAKKVGVSGAWLAWVPILNVYVVWWIAGWSAWTLMLGSVGAVGLVMLNPLIILVLVPASFCLMIWWAIRVAVIRGKPFWVGLLFLIPPIQWIVWGYLAFSNGKKNLR